MRGPQGALSSPAKNMGAWRLVRRPWGTLQSPQLCCTPSQHKTLGGGGRWRGGFTLVGSAGRPGEGSPPKEGLNSPAASDFTVS